MDRKILLTIERYRSSFARRWRRIANRLRRLTVRRLLAFAALALILIACLYQAVTWPDVAALRHRNPESTAFLDFYAERAARDGRPAARRRWVDYEQIAEPLKRAVLVAEDINFHSHSGFSTADVKLALREAWREGKRLRGASTITQQLAKNLWLSPSRNPWRKIKEAILVLQLEALLDKRRILELYLNVAEFGPGIYGAEAAARHFFQLSAAQLSDEQAAALAAALPRPATWHPGSASPGYKRHCERIRGRMRQAVWLERSL